MNSVIHVERDTDGLALAVRILLEEALVRHRSGSAMLNASDAEFERLEAEMPEREISPGYFTRAGYLMDLSLQLQQQIPIEPASLSRTDILGIRAVRAAHAEYERDHPSCPACGERQDNPHVFNCWKCQHKLRERSR